MLINHISHCFSSSIEGAVAPILSWSGTRKIQLTQIGFGEEVVQLGGQPGKGIRRRSAPNTDPKSALTSTSFLDNQPIDASRSAPALPMAACPRGSLHRLQQAQHLAEQAQLDTRSNPHDRAADLVPIAAATPGERRRQPGFG